MATTILPESFEPGEPEQRDRWIGAGRRRFLAGLAPVRWRSGLG